jgi:hypothetical protein
MGLLQNVGKRYFRIRHYLGVDPNTRKPMFQYHKQNIAHVREQLVVEGLTIDQFVSRHKTIDPIKLKTASKRSLVRGVGFEPTNPYGTAASGLRLWPCLATPALLRLRVLKDWVLG